VVEQEFSTETTTVSSRGRTQTPTFITSNDGGYKVGIFFGLFIELIADRNAVSVPFDHCSAALAQILLQCAAC
jgi:hypothetical protein